MPHRGSGDQEERKRKVMLRNRDKARIAVLIVVAVLALAFAMLEALAIVPGQTPASTEPEAAGALVPLPGGSDTTPGLAHLG
jgi:hypothetical protein